MDDPQNTVPDDKGASAKETLEVFGKIVIGLAGLCYVLGRVRQTAPSRPGCS